MTTVKTDGQKWVENVYNAERTDRMEQLWKDLDNAFNYDGDKLGQEDFDNIEFVRQQIGSERLRNMIGVLEQQLGLREQVDSEETMYLKQQGFSWDDRVFDDLDEMGVDHENMDLSYRLTNYRQLLTTRVANGYG